PPPPRPSPLSLHDALPIWPLQLAVSLPSAGDTGGLTRFTTTLRHTPGIASVAAPRLNPGRDTAAIAVYPTESPQSAQTTSLVKRDRKSTRLNSSHQIISYA